jgi:hypothetical protein
MAATRILHLLVVLFVLALGLPAGARAQRPAPVVTELRTQVGASINNLGVQHTLEWSRRRALAPTAGPLRSEAHVQCGAVTSVTPSFVRAGVWAQVAPLSILVVRAGVEPAAYFGTFNSLMSFDRRDAPFDTDSRKDRGGATSGTVWRWYVTPTLRVRLGRVIASANADIERWSASADGPLFYEPTRDTLLAVSGDTLIGLRHVVMYEHVKAGGARVAVGALHTLQRVDGFRHARLNQVEKLGGLFVWQSAGRVARMGRPTLTVSLARYLNDPAKRHGWTTTVTVGGTLRRREQP